jgi:hypothetical protein
VNESNAANEKPRESHKRVDEEWKKQVERERGREAAKPRQEPTPPRQAGDFVGFVSGLAMQAMMSLGEVPDPNTGMTRENLAEAKYLIDIIAMLQEKTKGNLTKQEEAAIQEGLYGLRMAYVRKTSPGQQPAPRQERPDTT